jgi:hypothetical protein
MFYEPVSECHFSFTQNYKNAFQVSQVEGKLEGKSFGGN